MPQANKPRPIRQQISHAVQELEGGLLFLLIALSVLFIPGTFLYLMFTTTGWTWLNLLPRIFYFICCSIFWIIYWPLNIISKI